MTLAIDEARRRLRLGLQPIAAQRGDLCRNIGATLARPLVTQSALPATDLSAMDGYAVSGTGPWVVRAGTQVAGTRLAAPLQPGEAIRIATGARMPRGSTAAIRDEFVDQSQGYGHNLLTLKPGAPDRNDVRRRGENWYPGTELAPAGQRVSPSVASAAVSAEVCDIELRGPLKAQIVLTGDEICTDGELRPGQTRDSVGPVIARWLRSLDVIVTSTVYVADSVASVTEAIEAASTVDIVFVVGATRHGPADFLRQALLTLGARFLVDGVLCRPAGTQIVASSLGGPTIHCLPGNPFSALASTLLLTPAIVDGLTARRPEQPLLGCVPEVGKLAHASMTRILPARQRPDGKWSASEATHTPHLAGLIGSSALALIPPKTENTEVVELLPLPR